MRSEGDRENSGGLSRGALANGHGHIREPHATSNTAASRSPRRGSARAAFSEHTRGAGVCARAGARLGQPRSWWRGDGPRSAGGMQRAGPSAGARAQPGGAPGARGEVARAIDKQLQRRADAAEARVTAVRG